mmetsp:Transcript_29791/g.81817  ORF Transcript_29791/g.81817 Transcript_29791/m.81817 type:complete len:212 (-) Transcript_29791:348-983(-)
MPGTNDGFVGGRNGVFIKDNLAKRLQAVQPILRKLLVASVQFGVDLFFVNALDRFGIAKGQYWIGVCGCDTECIRVERYFLKLGEEQYLVLAIFFQSSLKAHCHGGNRSSQGTRNELRFGFLTVLRQQELHDFLLFWWHKINLGFRQVLVNGVGLLLSLFRQRCVVEPGFYFLPRHPKVPFHKDGLDQTWQEALNKGQGLAITLVERVVPR